MVAIDPRLSCAGACLQKSYVLVLWRLAADDPWQYLLEAVGTGQKHLFATSDELAAYLKAAAADSSPTPVPAS